MKLLVTTQAVDATDPVLGFFVRWLEEFAKHCEEVTVICLRKGEYELPPNVRVLALTKDGPLYYKGRSFVRRIKVIFRFLRNTWRLRDKYDVVFVHMNPEYLVAAGWLWRLLGKKTALWYTHKSIDLKLRIAEKFVDTVFTASAESFRLPSRKVRVMGHGIDTNLFSPSPDVARGEHLLSVGRLSKSKRHDLVIRLAAQEGKALRIAGEGPERQNLEQLARELGARVEFLGGLTQLQLRDEYRRAERLVHTSETGSLDKVVLEAAACGLPVDTHDPVLAALPFSPDYVREHHSLAKLIPAILKELS